MAVRVKQLLAIWRIRLRMLEQDTMRGSVAYREAVTRLVSGLSMLDSDEEVDILVCDEVPVRARFVRVRTGEILADICG